MRWQSPFQLSNLYNSSGGVVGVYHFFTSTMLIVSKGNLQKLYGRLHSQHCNLLPVAKSIALSCQMAQNAIIQHIIRCSRQFLRQVLECRTDSIAPAPFLATCRCCISSIMVSCSVQCTGFSTLRLHTLLTVWKTNYFTNRSIASIVMRNLICSTYPYIQCHNSVVVL